MKTTTDVHKNNSTLDDTTPFLLKITQIFDYGLSKLLVLYQENKRNVLIITSMLLVALLLMIYIFNGKRNINNFVAMEQKNAVVIINRLQNIDSQLNQLTSTHYTPENFKTNIVNISSEIASLKSMLSSTVNKVDIQNVANQITSAKDELNTNILDIKKAVIDSSQSKQYISLKSLPFKVVSIDVISEKSFVSIEYDNHITPLLLGDSVAGWNLTSASYETGMAEFKNTKDQYIKLSIKD